MNVETRRNPIKIDRQKIFFYFSLAIILFGSINKLVGINSSTMSEREKSLSKVVLTNSWLLCIYSFSAVGVDGCTEKGKHHRCTWLILWVFNRNREKKTEERVTSEIFPLHFGSLFLLMRAYAIQHHHHLMVNWKQKKIQRTWHRHSFEKIECHPVNRCHCEKLNCGSIFRDFFMFIVVARAF